jgi:hypothetical protein
MSEYQYYEFRAIDRPLTEPERKELRALSTRARITPTSFVNFYHYGDFRGSPELLMAEYFDAFLYFANWGTRRLMLRLPRRLVDTERVSLYCPGDHASLNVKGEAVILEFWSENEAGDDWEAEEGEEEEGGTLGSLIPLRGDLLAGDLRVLYLGWLLAVQMGDLEDEEEEPPVPAGLGMLSDSLARFADFLRIDQDLIAVAAERSEEDLPGPPSRAEWVAWIGCLPESQKDALLLRAAEGQAVHLGEELLQRFRQEVAAAGGSGAEAGAAGVAGGRRTAGELLTAAERYGEERRRREAKRAAAERARQEREQAAARAKYLEGLQGREPELWGRVEELIKTKKPKEYDQAVLYLIDLRDLSEGCGREEEFRTRIGSLRGRHALKPSLMQRLDRAGLGTGDESGQSRG